MKLYQPDQAIISLHIPKSAGTSFISLLSEWFGTNLYLHYYNEKGKKPPVKYDLTVHKKYYIWGEWQSKCVHGHFNNKRHFGVKDYYPTISQFITFLRNPLETQISDYFYVKKQNLKYQSYRDGKKYEINMSLDEYITHGKSYLLDYIPFDLNADNYKSVFENFFVHLGVIEKYENSINILSEKLSKPFIRVPVENQSARDGYPSPKAIASFQENNALEFDIYNYAINLNK